MDTVRYLVNKGADVNIQDSKAVSECEYTADCELKHVTGKHLFSVTSLSHQPQIQSLVPTVVTMYRNLLLICK